MTRDEFLKQWGDELRGLLLESFAQDRESIGDLATKGRYMVGQMRRAQALLGRIYDSFKEESKEK